MNCLSPHYIAPYFSVGWGYTNLKLVPFGLKLDTTNISNHAQKRLTKASLPDKLSL